MIERSSGPLRVSVSAWDSTASTQTRGSDQSDRTSAEPLAQTFEAPGFGRCGARVTTMTSRTEEAVAFWTDGS